MRSIVSIEIHFTGTRYVAGVVGDDDHYELTRTTERLTREDAVEAAYELVLVDDERVAGEHDCDIRGCATCNPPPAKKDDVETNGVQSDTCQREGKGKYRASNVLEAARARAWAKHKRANGQDAAPAGDGFNE